MLTVLAIGGNSLIRSKERISFAEQMATLTEACAPVVELLRRGEQVVITHGNGPQVGFVLLRSYLARNRLPEIPLDAANAQTQAEIGYMIQQALGNRLREHGLRARVVTVVTRVVVDENDPAFSQPSKPVGPFYTREEAVKLEKQLGWWMKEDAGRGFRRLVPSPIPKAVVEIEEIRTLVAAGAIVVAGGGGGIPVIEQGGRLQGVAAVIDKDLASALLGNLLGARRLLISTGVDRVYLNYGQADAQGLSVVRTQEVREYRAQGHFPEGSMGPKIDAALRFLEGGGTEVLITDPTHLVPALEGQAGTRIIN
ncbi:MAG: carbamate kinase [candidate division WOR-3 bacterium]|jgi:carbamate kinase